MLSGGESSTGHRPVNTKLPSIFSRTQADGRLKGEFSEQDIKDFKQTCSQKIESSSYPLSASVLANVPIYDTLTLMSADRNEAMNELHHCLLSGPGVFVVRDLIPSADHDVIDRAEAAFAQITEKEKEAGQKGDHFAPAGANDRIWNSFQKFAQVDPEGFVRYFANEAIDLICEAWLGPGYAITTQTNIVKPGGKAQAPHRDYHLGFQAEHTAARFPIISQIASQLLTLQGAIAHTDMPVESGPTQLLPFSQHFDNGYVAYRHPEFMNVFNEMMVQLPLKKGDGLFFNPALFHAAGENRTEDFNRSANLLQISACWGKPMESVDRRKIMEMIWPVLRSGASEELGEKRVEALLKAVADGYSFPTNLDTDPPPNGGHCPETQLDLAIIANGESYTQKKIKDILSAMEKKRLP